MAITSTSVSATKWIFRTSWLKSIIELSHEKHFFYFVAEK